MKQMNMILIAIGLAIIAWAILGRFSEPSKREAWTIVVNARGDYSFRRWNGEVVEKDFPTREAAEAAMANEKEWSDEYDSRHERQRMRDAEFTKAP